MRAKDLLKTLNEAAPTRVRTLTQYRSAGNTSSAMGDVKLQAALEAGVYGISITMEGLQFEKKDVLSDGLLRFPDERQDLVLGEVAQFWNLKDAYDKYEFVHSRGMVLYGPPGSGKTCVLKLVMEQMVNDGSVVLMGKSPGSVREALKIIREVEADRKVCVVLEDIDEMVRYDEHSLLELLDGEEKIGGVLYLATTNFLERLPARLLRPPRFDRKIEVPFPPLEGRLAYLRGKLGQHQDESDIGTIAEQTEGFSFGHLRELIVSVYCLGHDLGKTVERLRGATSTTAGKGYSDQTIAHTACESRAKVRTKLKSLKETRGMKAKDLMAKLNMKEAEGELKPYLEKAINSITAAIHDFNVLKEKVDKQTDNTISPRESDLIQAHTKLMDRLAQDWIKFMKGEPYDG